MRIAAAALLFLVSGAAVALAHGTGWRVAGEKAVVLELYYADGEPMAFADVRVFSPNYANVPVLHGRADDRGRAAFVPDRDGTWLLVAADGEGHAIRAPVPVSLGAARAPAARDAAGIRLALAVSLLGNVGLLLVGWKLLSISSSRLPLAAWMRNAFTRARPL